MAVTVCDGLSVRDVGVTLGGNRIVDGVSFDVAAGGVVAVLGPSGSGKSTVLRAIAGLIASTGSVALAGVDLAALPTHRRGIGLMFQSHALFPHLSVAENVAFGLREQRLEPTTINQRVSGLLSLVDLDGYGDRRVAGLSGGEAQRVALARALAPEPKLLMLDEPLGALDRRLREELTAELSSLLRRTKTTALYVTHDQEEAAAVGERLLILRAGAVAAEGPADDLWRRPTSPWVAEFLGHPNVGPSSVVPVTAVRFGEGGTAAVVEAVRFLDGEWRVTAKLSESVYGLDRLQGFSPDRLTPGDPCTVSVDPTAITTFHP